MMKPLAVVTMVYDDDIYLDIWLRYWETRVPRGNLFVLIHKNYEHFENLLKGCNTLRIARPDMYKEFERDRWRMLSNFCSGLSYMFERVLYTDIDEIVVLDPDKGDDIVTYLLDRPEPVLCPFGVELVQNLSTETKSYTAANPVLTQRKFVAPHGIYSKPCATSVPICWGSGGHFCDREQLALSDDLILFHLRLFDEKNYVRRSKQRRQMIKDSDTGKPMRGVGGPSWRSSENELTTFKPTGVSPMTGFDFPKMRARWNNSAKYDDYRGVWQRKGPLDRKLFRIPERFEGLF